MNDVKKPAAFRLSKRKASWWLLLTIPVAVVCSYVLLFVTTLAWCGVPWLETRRTRLVLSAAVGLAFCLLILVWGTAGFIRG